MVAKHVCMFAKLRRARFVSLRKALSICNLIHFFLDSWGCCGWSGFPKPFRMWGFFKTPLPVRLFQNPSTCEAFSKHLCLCGVFKTYLPVRLFQNPSACKAFCKTHLPVRRAALKQLHISTTRSFSKMYKLPIKVWIKQRGKMRAWWKHKRSKTLILATSTSPDNDGTLYQLLCLERLEAEARQDKPPRIQMTSDCKASLHRWEATHNGIWSQSKLL